MCEQGGHNYCDDPMAPYCAQIGDYAYTSFGSICISGHKCFSKISIEINGETKILTHICPAEMQC